MVYGHGGLKSISSQASLVLVHAGIINEYIQGISLGHRLTGESNYLAHNRQVSVY